eukprot:gene16349-7744_t
MSNIQNRLKWLPVRNESAYPLCEEAVPMWELGCICRRSLCFRWFPCAIKTCPESNRSVNPNDKFDCGITGCKKCDLFEFYVPRKKVCFWDIQF